MLPVADGGRRASPDMALGSLVSAKLYFSRNAAYRAGAKATTRVREGQTMPHFDPG